MHVVACAPSSCQCRLEANYAHQTKLDMIPLMMQQNYSPNGWRKSQPIVSCCLLNSINAIDLRPFAVGLMLGTRLYYPMWDVETDDAFDRRMDGVAQEIGDRGKALVAASRGSLQSASYVITKHDSAPPPTSATSTASEAGDSISELLRTQSHQIEQLRTQSKQIEEMRETQAQMHKTIHSMHEAIQSATHNTAPSSVASKHTRFCTIS